MVPVVLFHAGLTAFSGGFVGVDVFFVISGYLITGILLGDIDRGRFSIARFYERRARRILPALFLVLACGLPFAWKLMLPEELARFGKSLLAVIGFASNMTFWREEGYFTDLSELKPLLHTWSLAVEEQFYIAFPLLLYLLRGLERRRLVMVLALAMLASFALCEVAAFRFQTANFYLAPTRAWELLAGSLCACIGPRTGARHAGWLAGLGLALILAGIFLLDGTMPFPSHWALLPVAGTALLILFAVPDRGAGRLLAMAPFVGIGLVSYSLYLWHQPLFAFARLAAAGAPSQGEMLALAALSGLLAWASWRFVERPFRRKDGVGRARIALPLALVGAAVLAGAGGWFWLSGGAPSRLPQARDPLLLAMTRADPPPRAEGGDCRPDADGLADPCRLVGGEGPVVALYGDSHAQALLPAYRQLAQGGEVALDFGGAAGCPPLLGGYVLAGNGLPEDCARLAQRQLAQARRDRPAVVWLVGRWSLYATEDPLGLPGHYLLADRPAPWRWSRADSRRTLAVLMGRTVDAYRALGVQVVVVDQVPNQSVRVDRLRKWLAHRDGAKGLAEQIRASSLDGPGLARQRESYAAALVEAKAHGALVLSLDEPFRQGDRYLWGRPGEAWYRDASHLSTVGALRLAPALVAQYDVLSGGAAPR